MIENHEQYSVWVGYTFKYHEFSEQIRRYQIRICSPKRGVRDGVFDNLIKRRISVNFDPLEHINKPIYIVGVLYKRQDTKTIAWYSPISIYLNHGDVDNDLKSNTINPNLYLDNKNPVSFSEFEIVVTTHHLQG